MTKATGDNVNYYLVEIKDPKRLSPYTAEAEDIIEALGMTFAEGNAFKALWRSCAARALGVKKPGSDEQGIYDAEKAIYYSKRVLAVRQRAMPVKKELGQDPELVELSTKSSLYPNPTEPLPPAWNAAHRIFDMLIGDDGQAFKEAERFLAKEFPQLNKELQTRRAQANLGIDHP